MRAAANIGGHPIHPMLVGLPIGMWVLAVVADLLFMWRGNPAWELIAFYSLAAGCIGAALAAVFGLIDLIGIKDTPAFRTGLFHAGFNVVALLIFAASWYLRTSGGSQMVGTGSKIPFALSLVGLALLAVAGWLGGEMVFKGGVGVETQANTADGQ